MTAGRPVVTLDGVGRKSCQTLSAMKIFISWMAVAQTLCTAMGGNGGWNPSACTGIFWTHSGRLLPRSELQASTTLIGAITKVVVILKLTKKPGFAGMPQRPSCDPPKRGPTSRFCRVPTSIRWCWEIAMGLVWRKVCLRRRSQRRGCVSCGKGSAGRFGPIERSFWPLVQSVVRRFFSAPVLGRKPSSTKPVLPCAGRWLGSGRTCRIISSCV